MSPLSPSTLQVVVEQMKHAELCLGISASLVVFVGGAGLSSGNLESLSTLVLGILMLFSVLSTRGYLTRWRINEIFPLLPVAAVSGISLLLAALILLEIRGGLWTSWVTLVAAIFALCFMGLRLRRPPLLSEEYLIS